MSPSRVSATIGVALACFALAAAPQGTATTTDPGKTPKAEESKEGKKADAKKAEPKKGQPAKTDPKKADPKKAPAKKVDTKPQATRQGGTVQKYEAGKTPELKDAKGNTIPTSPDAYDLSSANNPPAKKK